MSLLTDIVRVAVSSLRVGGKVRLHWETAHQDVEVRPDVHGSIGLLHDFLRYLPRLGRVAHVLCREGHVVGGGVAMSIRLKQYACTSLGRMLFAESDRGSLPRWLRQDRPRDCQHSGDDEKHARTTGGGSSEGEKADFRANKRSGDAKRVPYQYFHPPSRCISEGNRCVASQMPKATKTQPRSSCAFCFPFSCRQVSIVVEFANFVRGVRVVYHFTDHARVTLGQHLSQQVR